MSTQDARWRQFFQVAAAYNVGLGIPFLLVPHQLFAFVGMNPPEYAVFSQMLFSFVVLLGWGYWRVAVDLDSGRDMVRLGLACKLIAFCLCVGHALLGNIPPIMAGPGIGDLLFSIGFMRFLQERPGP